MEIKLKIKVVVTLPTGWKINNKLLTKPEDKIVCSIEKSSYDPECLNLIIPSVLQSACETLSLANISDLKALLPEVSVYLCVDNDECRPALHLDAKTISIMSKAGSAFDFDPYA